MLNYILKKIFGTQNTRTLKLLWPIIEQVNAFNGGVVRALTGLRSQQSSLQDEIDRLAMMTSTSAVAQEPLPPQTAIDSDEVESDLRRQVRELGERLAALEEISRQAGHNGSDA
jgi:hypothetical protein